MTDNEANTGLPQCPRLNIYRGRGIHLPSLSFPKTLLLSLSPTTMADMTRPIYSMSFTTASLLYHESLIVARLYAEWGDWETVRNSVISENRLQMRTLNASNRIYQEVTSRLKLLSPAQFDLFCEGSRQEQNNLLWLAVCKRYRFIYDFAVEVIREKFLRLDLSLTYDEYDAFFNAKAEWHPEVERIAAATRAKQRQVVFKMLREADLLSIHNQIMPISLTPTLVEVIRQEEPGDLAIFPLTSRL